MNTRTMMAPPKIDGIPATDLRIYSDASQVNTTISFRGLRGSVKKRAPIDPRLDAYIYITPAGEIFTHPTYDGAVAAVCRSFVDVGALPVPPGNTHLDDIDANMLRARMEAKKRHHGPQVGDWLRYPNDDMRRFTHHWGDGLQVASGTGDYGSFYFDDSGLMSYSGGLDPSIPTKTIKATDQTAPARAWFFHHDHRRGHNGVTVSVEVPVWELMQEVAE